MLTAPRSNQSPVLRPHHPLLRERLFLLRSVLREPVLGESIHVAAILLTGFLPFHLHPQ